MAVLYGRMSAPDMLRDQLPSVHELSEADRVNVELVRLECLLGELKATIPTSAHPVPASISSLRLAWPGAVAPGAERYQETGSVLRAFHSALADLNLQLLESLACGSQDVQLAYQLGRALRDTVNPPETLRVAPPVPLQHGADSPATRVLSQLSRGRIATLQEWLKVLGPNFPSDSAAVVSASLGRWSDLAVTALDPSTPGALSNTAQVEPFAWEMLQYLLPQGNLWLNILTGDQSTAGLLTPESSVAAAEAAFNRASRLAGRVLWHYRIALAALAVALGTILYLAAAFMGGAAQVWTQIAAIAASLGVTARGVGSTVARLAEEGARPIYVLETTDAKVWAITTMPPVKLNKRGVSMVRRGGIVRSSQLGRA
jgi:hypothetical protein